MANLYGRYSMQSLSVAQVARLMFGRAAPMAPPRVAVRPSVNSFFKSSVQTNPMAIDQPVWVLDGSGLQGLGVTALGAGGLKFKNDHAAQNFAGGLGMDGGCDGRPGVFRPISPGMLTQIAARLDELSASGSQAFEDFMSKAQGLVGRADELQQFDTNAVLQCGRTDARERQYHSALNALKAHMLSALDISVPATRTVSKSAISQQQDEATGGGSGGGGGGARRDGDGLPKWALPVGIGVAALAGGFFLMKRK